MIRNDGGIKVASIVLLRLRRSVAFIPARPGLRLAARQIIAKRPRQSLLTVNFGRRFTARVGLVVGVFGAHDAAILSTARAAVKDACDGPRPMACCARLTIRAAVAQG